MNKTPYILLAMLVAACSSNDSIDLAEVESTGSIALATQISNVVQADITTRASGETYQIADELVPSVDELALAIFKKSTDDSYVLYKEYATINDYNNYNGDDTPPSLPIGNYMAVASSGDIELEGETSAYFADSVNFTIIPSENIGTASLDVKLANSIVRLNVTDAFNNYFEGGASLTISTEDGASLSLNFPASEDEQIMFVAPDTNIYLWGTAVKQDPGTGTAPTVTFTKSLIGVAEAGILNSIVLDASSTGSSSITVTINDTITTVGTTTIDVNSGSVTTEN
ncbi:MAG: DUF4493 domain-containing protein [Rikenellaceae bacterium]